MDSVISGNSFSDVTNDLTALSISEESDTVIIANRSPDEAVDLTTLSGRKNKYKKMVETLFRSDFGNVKLGDILLTSKDEFLNEYGKSPQTRSLLRGWIEEYNLGDRFSKVESGESISIFAQILEKVVQLEILILSFNFFLNATLPLCRQSGTKECKIRRKNYADGEFLRRSQAYRQNSTQLLGEKNTEIVSYT